MPRWRRLRPRYIAAGVLALAVVVVALGWLVTSSPLTRWVVMRAIEKSVPLDASCARVRIDADGMVRIEDLRVGGPGHPAGPILESPVCLVDVDWSTLLSSRVRVREIALDGARVRVSVDRETGVLNLQPLLAMSAGGEGVEVPEVVLHDARVEFGEHGVGGFDRLESLTLDGQLSRLDGRSGFAMGLSEREGPLRMLGEVTPSRASIEVRGMSLGRFGPRSMPTRIRDVMLALDLEGEVPSVRLDYTRDTGVVASARIDDVALNLPFERDWTFSARPTNLARMTGVVGSISVSRRGLEADLRGAIEDLEYVARLESRDDPAGDAFTLTLATEGFVLEEHPRLVPYVPTAIERALADFSRPTGVIDASIEVGGVITPEGGIGAVEVRSGLVRVRDMRASHVEFPYEVADVSGEIRFDASSAELVGFRGRAASGATAAASGTISPLNEEAVLRLDASLVGVGVDEHLRAALGERAMVLDELFSEARLAELRELGLDEGMESFALGAKADLDVSIVSGESETSADAVLRIGRAAVLPERFPLPFYAEDVVIDASMEAVEIRAGRFMSLAGDEVAVEGGVGILRAEDGELEVDPRLRIVARGARSTPQVLHAIAQAGETHDDPREWTGRMMRELGLDGRFDAEVAVLRREDGSLGYEADVRGEGATMTPTGYPEAGELRVTNIAGRVVADERHVEIEASGMAGSAPVRSETTILFAGAEPRVDSRTTVSGGEAALPIEQVIGAFAKGAAATVAELREARGPSGKADAEAHILLVREGEEPTVVVRVTEASGLAFDDPLGRMELKASDGELVWRSDETIRFDRFGADVAIDGVDQGCFTLDGLLDLTGERASFDLAVEGSGVRLAGAIARTAIDRALDEDSRRRVASLELAGLVDATVAVRREPGGGATASGTIRPERMSFRKGARRIRLLDASGEIDFDEHGLVAREVRGRLAGWEIEASGALRRSEGGLEVSGALFSRGERLTDEVLGVLSSNAMETAREIELSAGGAGSLDLTQVHAAFDPAGRMTAMEIDGRAMLLDASLSAGVDISSADIHCDFAIRRDESDDLRTSAILSAPELRVERVRASDAYVRIQSRDGGSLWLPEFSASSHGGRFGGSAVFEGLGVEAPTRYSLTLRLSEIALAPLLDDLRNAAGAGGDAERREGSDRGVLHGELSVAGELGDLASQRGRGGARVFGGRVVDLPLLLQLVRVANLRLPSSEDVDLAIASFYIDGPRVVFEDLSAFAGPIEIFGFGTVTLPERSLDLRFVPRISSSIPLVGAIIEGINREFMSARVRGTLEDRQFSVEPLRGTFSMLGRVAGARSDADILLERVERQAERSRSRMLRMTERARALSSDGEDGSEP